MYKLLIVDDELIEREALQFIVKNSQLEISEIREAANGNEAIAVAADFNPDIVILDIKMPGLNGLEAGHIIKKMHPDIKIVFMTAFDRFEYAQEAIKVGVEEFIVKPAPIDRTIEILEKCIVKIEKDKKMKNQKEKLEVKLNQISHYLENEFVSSVVNGEIDEQQADDYLKFMLSEFTEGFGVVIDVDFINEHDANHLHRNMIKKRFVEKLTFLLDGNMKFLKNQVKNTFYFLVFGYPADQRSIVVRTIEDEIRMVCEQINEQMEARIYYGFGNPCVKISMLWKSFAQAKAAARNMFIDLTENTDDSDTLMTSSEFKENELCESILNGNQEEAIKLADHILDDIVYSSGDINANRLKLYEFFILLNSYMNKESQLKHAVPDYLFNDVKNIDSRGEARNYIHQYLFGILEETENQKVNRTPAILDKAVKYIQDNYAEGITLEDVANEIGFSTYYFGKMFKKTFKSSFTDYLSNVRITQAKILLKDPDLSVKDITYNIGFMDPNYFTRVFKKSEGMTPTEYRNKG